MTISGAGSTFAAPVLTGQWVPDYTALHSNVQIAYDGIGSGAGNIGALILGLGRAVGETMAVTMVIGNTPKISASLLAPGYSIAAVLANESGEAFSNPLHIGML